MHMRDASKMPSTHDNDKLRISSNESNGDNLFMDAVRRSSLIYNGTLLRKSHPRGHAHYSRHGRCWYCMKCSMRCPGCILLTAYHKCWDSTFDSSGSMQISSTQWHSIGAFIQVIIVRWIATYCCSMNDDCETGCMGAWCTLFILQQMAYMCVTGSYLGTPAKFWRVFRHHHRTSKNMLCPCISLMWAAITEFVHVACRSFITSRTIYTLRGWPGRWKNVNRQHSWIVLLSCQIQEWSTFNHILCQLCPLMHDIAIIYSYPSWY